MFGTTADNNPLVGESLIEETAHLGGQAFLHLQSACESIDDAGSPNSPKQMIKEVCKYEN